MRRLELLVQEVRDSSDTNDLNSYSIYELMRYFNDGQKLIQKIIHAANPDNGLFHKFYDADVPANGVIALPDDIYAKSCIVDVGFIRDNNYFSQLDKLTYGESANIYGYTVINDQIIVSERLNVDQFRMEYVYKLPVMSYRLGKISALDSGAGTVTLDPSTIITDEDFVLRFDEYSIVDKKGNIITDQLFLDDYTGGVFTFDSPVLTDVTTDHYVVCGRYGTSHSQLPDSCEPFLMSYVQRRIKDKISTTDAANEAIFTQEERQDLEDLFADQSKKPKSPPVLDTDYLSI